MDHQEKLQLLSPSLPVLSRLDRLDRLLQLLEERHSTSPVKKEEECKTLSSALEEVNHKGTLMERLAMLETRVLQLSLDMEVKNISKSSSTSSTIQMPEKSEPSSRDDEDIIDNFQVQEKQEFTLVELEACGKKRRRKSSTIVPRRKWFGFGWLRMRC